MSVDRNCLPLLAGFFIRVLKSLSYVFRGKNGEIFSSMEFLSNFLALWANFLPSGMNHLSGLLKVPDASSKGQFVGHNLFWKLLILFMFTDKEWENFRFCHFLPERFPKLFFTCPEKKFEQNRFFEKKFGFWAETIQLFIGKFFKGLLRLHCTCQVDKFEEKTFFIRKLDLSFFCKIGENFR